MWKLPCQKYHISCRNGRPRINWMAETATLAWDKFQLWRNIGGTMKGFMPDDFDYRKRTHVRIVINEAVKGCIF